MKINKEIWRDVPGYEGYYQVSNTGIVRSLDRTVITKRGERSYKGRIFEGNLNNGYKILSLSRDGKQEIFLIHQLVAMIFLNHEPNGHTLVVDHINGIKTDNRIENLRIVTQRDNSSTCHRTNEDLFSSKFVGVSWDKVTKKWRAQIIFNSKKIYLGLFDNEIDAAKAYQKALAELENGTFKIEDYRTSFISKFKGVSFNKANQKYITQPYINGKQIYLGSFENEEEAYQAILLHEAIQPIVKNC